MSKDLHGKPFDEMTIAKLEIFEDYAQAWIPTFVMQGNMTICIFDFFAGPGYDSYSIKGSPIRILEKIKEQVIRIFQQQINVEVFFNEFDKTKFRQLSENCHQYLAENDHVSRAVKLHLSNEDFDTCFSRLLPHIRKQPSLVYLDQNGIRFLSEKYLLELEKIERTDFIYFASASHLWRFGESEEFQNNLQIDMNEVKKYPRQFVHRSLIRELKKKLPIQTKLRLYPFSLKKGPNIHGIIFCATHPRAVDKFLNIAWKRNEINGEANFDIDDDVSKAQLDLFGENKLTKKDAFKQKIRENILNGSITNNWEAFDFALGEGHLGSHAAEEIKQMKFLKLIDYEGASPLVTYENTYKNKKFLKFTIFKK